MKIYLAGRMSGVPQFNYPAFMAAAEKLRTEGHEVFNPAENDGDSLTVHGQENGVNFETGEVIDPPAFQKFLGQGVFVEDLIFICKEADAIALLPGWEHSGGARAEWAVANVLRKKVIYL